MAHHVAAVLDHRARTLWLAGRAAEAETHFDEIARIESDYEAVPTNSVRQRATQGMVFARLGRYREALQAFEQARAFFPAISPRYVASIVSEQAACLADLGQWARVQALLAAMAGPTDGTSHRDLFVAGLTAAMQRALGRPATSALDDLWQQVPEDEVHWRGWGVLQLAPLWPPAQALQRLEALRQQLAPLGFDGHVVTAHLRSAQIATATDARPRAHMRCRP